ncbi:MAG: hypothetical protein LC800_00135 [Acidobacteria bacterium]|nr:hypothetical protein [Acidobacteriota bacterium]
MTREQKVTQEMEKVIDSWCHAEAGEYDARTTLESLWTDKYGTASPYASRGVPKLINEIHDNAFFRNCEVGVGLFMPGGGIQSVGDLHFFLSPCGGDS